MVDAHPPYHFHPSDRFKLLRSTLDSLKEAVFLVHPGRREIVDCNAFAEELFGWSRSELIGDSTRKLHVSGETHREFGRRSQKVLEGNNFFREEFKMMRKNGETFLSDHTVTLTRTEAYNAPIVVSVVRDITDQKRRKERLIRSLLEGEDRERSRIAGELHDGLGQYLSAANMHLEAARVQMGHLPEKARELLDHGMNLLKESISELRTISHNLLPRAIEEYGLPRALEILAEQYRSAKFTVTLNHNLDGLELSRQAERNLYRILQEALRNAVAHSGGSRVSVQLYRIGETVHLTVEDNGKGMNTKVSLATGSGLASMKRRARAMGGSLEMDSAPGKGTILTLHIPVESNTPGPHEER